MRQNTFTRFSFHSSLYREGSSCTTSPRPHTDAEPSTNDYQRLAPRYPFRSSSRITRGNYRRDIFSIGNSICNKKKRKKKTHRRIREKRGRNMQPRSGRGEQEGRVEEVFGKTAPAKRPGVGTALQGYTALGKRESDEEHAKRIKTRGREKDRDGGRLLSTLSGEDVTSV
ncbi:Hypothetical protein NTJ_06941 [Nesidiocoris tenuis]|uniref:Uncharacterized protein n=1 Tax=Nesidiocoris tenuis TaxID=355587 RepID=A0ABN7AUK5_9HEMI|nr:Hypothetical protein NTJ_06941 [Nesidiocoris tenuis]